MPKRQPVLVSLLLFFYYCSPAQESPLIIWYNKPADSWEQTLPLGNGRLGMTPDGNVYKEKIVLNDITLWSGSPQDANNYEAHKSLPQIRKLIFEGKNDEAQQLVNKNFVCKGQGSAGAQWGKYQTLGSLVIDFKYNGKREYQNYRRQLSLDSAVAGCNYTVGDVKYKREYFTSFNNDVNVIKLTTDRPGQLNCSISLNRPEKFVTKTTGKDLLMTGQLDNGTDGNGMKYIAKATTVLKDGTLTTTDTSLVVSNATEIIIYITAFTNFRNPDFEDRADGLLKAAMSSTYESERSHHVSRFRAMFSRLSFTLGEGTSAHLPTDERLSQFYSQPQQDVSLAALFFQYGRYLTISSTRVGLLPPNLQGLWAKEINTPWNGDYHLDVNVQMNHWPVEVTNLSELNLPLSELVKGLVEPGKRTARAYYGANGWIAHVITNVWGFTEPGESASWGVTNSGSGWLCSNLWDHYAFTLDKKYLKDIYPVLKGSAEFYNSVLVRDPKTGWMVTSPSVSPENSFYLPNGKSANVSMGPTIDNQIMRELFNNVITAAGILQIDRQFVKQLKSTLTKIPPTGVISRDGRIQEWIEDYKETDPLHRHISHLYGLFPAPLITPSATPDLAAAAKRSLEVRGDDGPSWSIAYKLLFWARLGDGNRAFKLLKELLKPTLKTEINYGAGGGVYPNLLSAGPPFQIDGNFGATAGIAEMLIQSHEGFIHLLPAIPDGWKKTGAVVGLKARGNLTVNMSWKDGRITNYKIMSPVPVKVRVKVNGGILNYATTKLEQES